MSNVKRPSTPTCLDVRHARSLLIDLLILVPHGCFRLGTSNKLSLTVESPTITF
jgi:hypothetical protein